MKFHAKHGKVTQIMHGASRNYRYVWDVSNPHTSKDMVEFVHEVHPVFVVTLSTFAHMLYE